MMHIKNFTQFNNNKLLTESINHIYMLLESETREYKRGLLKKVFGETAADAVLRNLSITTYPIESVIKYLQNKLPIKSTFVDIVENLAGYLNQDFLKQNNEEDKPAISEHTLEELLKRVNYNVDVVNDVNEAISKYLKYYKPNERICTLNSNDRFKNSFVTFFKHKDIDTTYHVNDLTQNNINDLWKIYLTDEGRLNDDGSYDLNGLKPNSADPYSKSLLCVQISKIGKTLKTISRYNHTVNNPDYVYKNLDDIVDGLHDKFYSNFNIDVPTGSKDELPEGYVLDSDNRLFKWLDEVDGNRYGDGFIIKSDGTTKLINKREELLIDGNVFNLKTSECILFSEELNIGIVKKIIPLPNNNYKITVDYYNQIYNAIIEVKDSCLISFKSDDLNYISNNFLRSNKTLTSINLPNVTNIGSGFLYKNENLDKIDLPIVEEIGNNFLNNNEKLTSIDVPSVTEIGNDFLLYNTTLKEIDLPIVTNIGSGFLDNNKTLEKIDLPKVTKIGDYFLCNNKELTSIDLPKVTEIGNDFLRNNITLDKIDLPIVKKIGNNFLRNNKNLDKIDLPKVTNIGDGFLCNNKTLTSIDLPIVTKIGNNFLYNNDTLTSINLPIVTKIGYSFLEYNNTLNKRDFPIINEYE